MKTSWYLTPDGYALSSTLKILMHRFIMNPQARIKIDHINNNRLDNRKCNLREVTDSENAQNKRKRGDDGYIGVIMNEYKSKITGIIKESFYAKIMKNGKSYWSKSCETKEEAAREYDRLALELYGKHANVNFPKLVLN